MTEHQKQEIIKLFAWYAREVTPHPRQMTNLWHSEHVKDIANQFRTKLTSLISFSDIRTKEDMELLGFEYYERYDIYIIPYHLFDIIPLGEVLTFVENGERIVYDGINIETNMWYNGFSFYGIRKYKPERRFSARNIKEVK